MARKQKHAQFSAEQDQKPEQKRVLSGKITIHSDLFKLEVASCNVNKSWTDAPDLHEQEHMHWFHTYDSDGKKHLRSNAVSGHFHMIEYEEQGEGKPVKILSVSGPMHEVKRKVKGRWAKVVEPVSATLEDDHTHAIRYIKTDMVELRVQSAQAISIVAAEANLTAPIAGVAGF